ncbi:MAG: hypothetical protein E4G98_04180 [Promethearchaeota archaeon]|nr:MAG: hypothetical protein E4G98_04180 [Candidatus Lokiarchaeota archaeon]
MSIKNATKQEIAEAEMEVETLAKDPLSDNQSRFPDESSQGVFVFGSLNDIQVQLEAHGYQIPVLQVERQITPLTELDGDRFRLPITKHDIYEDVEYAELCDILKRITSTYSQNPEELYFRIDYRSIWKGLTGSAM